MSAIILYELQLLAASLSVGLCLMAVYDGLRIFRVLVPHGSLWTGVEDAFYWILSSVTTFLLLFWQNDGILRWYAIMGVLMGMLIYNMTISRILLRLLKKIEKYFTIRRKRRRIRQQERRQKRQQRREQKRKQKAEERDARMKKRQKKLQERQKRREAQAKLRETRRMEGAADAGEQKSEEAQKRKSE